MTMINADRRKNEQLNNRGFALVTVIIAIAFVSILVTAILYLSVMNYQMKSNDYKTRVSFYGAETPLEELRVQFALDMAEASEEAYKQVMVQYGALEVEGGSPGSEGVLRTAEYQTAITTAMEEIWTKRTENAAAGIDKWCYGIGKILQEDLNDVVAGPQKYHVITQGPSENKLTCGTNCGCNYHVILTDTEGKPRLDVVDNQDLDQNGTFDYYIAFRGIKVSYTENSFSSVISTDYCMLIPNYDWSHNESDMTWGDDSTLDREKVSYEQGVVYLNYRKQ